MVIPGMALDEVGSPSGGAGSVRVRLERLAHAADLELPQPATAGASGVDLRAAVASSVPIEPGARVLVPTGWRIEIPPGWEGQVRPRSGLALRHGITVANAPGTIDSDYRGEIQVILVNLGAEAFDLRRGERIAQLVLAPVGRWDWEEVEPGGLAPTERGAGGFGSTGR